MEKFTQGLRQHIDLEKGIPDSSAVPGSPPQPSPSSDKTMGQHCLNRVKMLLKYGLSEEKIRKANIKDVAICIEILLKKSKELGVSIEEEQRAEAKGVNEIKEKEIVDAVTNIGRRAGIYTDLIREATTPKLSVPTGNTAPRAD
ncbi:MAG: hypothetical protein DDT23_00617 [candidate division WS2 bacterium]|nr:hypothetical protein [Candidatus Lithacetigena glycinireducens]